MDPFPPPTGGASLILSFRMHTKSVLIVGGDTLAASRAYASLEADAVVKVLVNGGLEAVCEELKWRAEHGQLEVIDWDYLPVPESSAGSVDTNTSGTSRDMAALDHYLANTPISLVCVTDTTSTSPFASISRLRAIHLARLCRAHHIPVNVTDMPEFCDFSFTATHRFVDPVSSSKTPLQIGVTTNREGCRLGGRVRREIIAGLSKDVGAAVTKVGQLRKIATKLAKESEAPADGEGGEDCTVTTPNSPVPIRPPGDSTTEESSIEASRRQMRWVVQVSEYWPISRLAAMTEREMKEILDGDVAHEGNALILSTDEKKSQHGIDLTLSLPKHTNGRILLAGSGPGHPSLLTLATHTALTKLADIVLSDKLVPAPVLELIPPHVEVRIARKFPGNADGAQSEMMEAAVEAANRGLTVVRLKQGDPIVYARAGEELAYFRAHGYSPLVLPGLSSALAAPACAGIPVTHRGVAESFVVCTGVGRQGKTVSLPGYDRARTVLVLMGVARLGEVVRALVTTEHGGRRDGSPYPAYLPIAIIERGSMPDQRVLVSTLEDVECALAGVGEQRPPGMIVIGWAVLAFGRKEEEGGDAGEGVLEDVEVDAQGQERRDRQRITRWLGGRKWDSWEGLGAGWADL
ncbi:uroporphyrin-III C-methyltransferase [Boletus coccyginus]|nr:uroporphyrin-III C-methyltransferase [Boletus coccyginus]